MVSQMYDEWIGVSLRVFVVSLMYGWKDGCMDGWVD